MRGLGGSALPFVLALGGCSADLVATLPSGDQPVAAETTPDATPGPADPGVEIEPGVDVEGIEGSGTGDPPEKDVSSDWIFSLDAVYTAELWIDEADIDALESGDGTPAPAMLTFHGEDLGVVGVRIKGRLGSYRTFDGKPALKIDLNQYDAETNLSGLERLNFNNMVQDSSMAHERVAYALYNAVGVAAPRVGYVWLRVNDQDYGLYTNVEVYDDEWLKRAYADPEGNLYDGDYFMWENGNYTLVDFNSSTQDLFILDEGEDVGWEDIHRVTGTLADNRGTSNLYAALDEFVDMDEVLHLWAADAWLGQYDGYTYNRNNYRVYFDPTDGRARLHPWDPDWAFYASTPIGSPYGELAAACWAEATCQAAFHAVMDEVKAAADAADLQGELDGVVALIPPYVQADPRREYDLTSVQNAQNSLQEWITGRSQQLTDMGY